MRRWIRSPVDTACRSPSVRANGRKYRPWPESVFHSPTRPNRLGGRTRSPSPSPVVSRSMHPCSSPTTTAPRKSEREPPNKSVAPTKIRASGRTLAAPRQLSPASAFPGAETGKTVLKEPKQNRALEKLLHLQTEERAFRVADR